MSLADFGEGGFFGFVGDGEASEISEGRESLLAAFIEQILGKSGKIGFYGGLDNGVIGLISLDDNAGGIEMPASHTANNLGEEFESTFFGGEIRESKASIGLNNAYGGQMGQIEAASQSLGADQDVNGARFDGLIEVGEIGVFLVIAVKTGDFGLGKEIFELRFEQFGAKTLMDDARMMAMGAVHGDFCLVATDMTGKEIAVGVERHREIAFGAEGLPTAFFADGQG